MPSWNLRVIEDAPPSANVFLRMHWTARMKLKRLWAWLVLEAGAREVPLADGKRCVKVEVRSKGKRDPQNSWTPVDKLIVDNLVRCGALKDDSAEWCDLRVITIQGEPRTRIRIESR